MQNALARVRNPALRQGLIFGIVLGIILLAVSFIGFNNLTFTLILCLLAAFIAGLRASQETGRLTTATLAGLWTGLIGVLIPSIISTVFVLVNIDSYRKSLQASADKLHQHITVTNSTVLTSLLISVLFLLVIGILPGAIGGLLGGIFGSRRAQIPPVEEYKEAIFEPPSSTEAEELPAASEVVESPTESEVEEQLSETPSKKPSSPTQQAE